MIRTDPESARRLPAHVALASVTAIVLILLALLTACTGEPPTEPSATEEPPTSLTVTEIPALTATLPPPSPPPEVSSVGSIPFGVYAMMDWGRASGAGNGQEHPWVVAGHYAFTWRQVNPTPGVYDWDLVDRWLATEAGTRQEPTGKQVGLGINAYEGGAGEALPEWVAQASSLFGYPHARAATIAASEFDEPDIRPALLLEVRQPGADQLQTLRLQQGVDGFFGCADTWISASDPAANHATENTMIVGAAAQANLLLGFHPSGMPESAQVVSARLQLHVIELASQPADASIPLGVYEIQRMWQPSSATWSGPQAGQDWIIRGANGVMGDADRGAGAIGHADITGSGFVEIVLDAEAIQAWVADPTANLGFLIKQEPADLVLPRYWDREYLAALSDMVSALAARYGADPRVAWVEISVGIYGETTPANEATFKWAYAEAGLTSETELPERGIYSWVQTVREIIDIYHNAFPSKTLFLQYSNNYESVSERAAYVPYAVEKGIGLKHNGLYPDSIDGATYGGSAIGTFNIMFTYSATVPVAWEFQVFPRTEANVYWAMLNALDKHADLVLVQKDAITRTELVPVFDFANTYLGATLETTPDVWVALRETVRPAERWNTQHGNFSFYLYQSDTAPRGKTVPVWNVTEAREGAFARSTDQATGNPYIFFDVDDRYFQGGKPISLEVIFLDQGRDSWHVEYDARGAEIKSLDPVEKQGSGQWRSARYTLIDAEMRGDLEGYDFRIDCEQDGDEVIHLVRLAVLDG